MHSNCLFYVTVEPRYFELSGQTENSAKYRDFEMNEKQIQGKGFGVRNNGEFEISEFN